MWRWALGLAVCAGCSDVEGDWEGECKYDAPGGDRKVKLVLSLDEMSDKGVGEGTAKIIDDGDKISADILYESEEGFISIDLYPKSGRDLFLRGETRDGGLAGACGDEPPPTINVEEALGCVTGVDADCGEASEWKKGNRPAPVTSDDLSGHFSLDRS